MSDAPWSKADAEKAARTEFERLVPHNHKTPEGEPWPIEKSVTMQAFLAGVAWAAEMIEASPTIVQMEPGRQFGWYDERDHLHHKYQRQAKLVNVKPIEKDMQAGYAEPGGPSGDL